MKECRHCGKQTEHPLVIGNSVDAWYYCDDCFRHWSESFMRNRQTHLQALSTSDKPVLHAATWAMIAGALVALLAIARGW